MSGCLAKKDNTGYISPKLLIYVDCIIVVGARLLNRKLHSL